VRSANRLIPLVLLYGLANAVLYCGLLPLWEGWDEPFHYAYVQSLSVRHELPVMGRSQLSREIWQSLRWAPVSHVVRQNMPELMSFETYFALPEVERATLRQRIENIPASEKRNGSGTQENYQAHHAPLAFAALAVPDAALSSAPLLVRVLWLRLICAVLCALLTAGAALALCRHLELAPHFQAALLFCVFSSQAFWAASAHIANDWLAIPLAAWLLAALIRYLDAPSGKRRALFAALILSLGLLTKAHFLAFVPLAVIVFVWRRGSWRTLALCAAIVLLVAGPWYARNLALYGNFSGMMETASIGAGRAFAEGFRAVHWLSAIPYMARASLWSGNNSFTSFSQVTLNLLLALLAAGFVLHVRHMQRRGWKRPELVIAAGIASFCAALVFVTSVSVWFTRGAEQGAKPWYTQLLLVPVLCLVFAGCEKGGRWGRAIAAVIVSVWTYLILATYFAKLLPLYGGYVGERATLSALVAWYSGSFPRTTEILGHLCLLGPATIYGLLALVSLLAVSLCAALCVKIAANRD
jgi:hypothetical protein